MGIYKIVTKISADGVIQLGNKPELFDREVEIIITPKSIKKESKAISFINKWAGFLKETNADDQRYNYLIEKYK